MLHCYFLTCLSIGVSLALATGAGASVAVDCSEPVAALRTPEPPNAFRV